MVADQEMPFGARLRALRDAAGMSQEELAEQAGLTANAVGCALSGASGGGRIPIPCVRWLMPSTWRRPIGGLLRRRGSTGRATRGTGCNDSAT